MQCIGRAWPDFNPMRWLGTVVRSSWVLNMTSNVVIISIILWNMNRPLRQYRLPIDNHTPFFVISIYTSMWHSACFCRIHAFLECTGSNSFFNFISSFGFNYRNTLDFEVWRVLLKISSQKFKVGHYCIPPELVAQKVFFVYAGHWGPFNCCKKAFRHFSKYLWLSLGQNSYDLCN